MWEKIAEMQLSLLFLATPSNDTEHAVKERGALDL